MLYLIPIALPVVEVLTPVGGDIIVTEEATDAPQHLRTILLLSVLSHYLRDVLGIILAFM
jgi:hypothetical protein